MVKEFQLDIQEHKKHKNRKNRLYDYMRLLTDIRFAFLNINEHDKGLSLLLNKCLRCVLWHSNFSSEIKIDAHDSQTDKQAYWMFPKYI